MKDFFHMAISIQKHTAIHRSDGQHHQGELLTNEIDGQYHCSGHARQGLRCYGIVHFGLAQSSDVTLLKPLSN